MLRKEDLITGEIYKHSNGNIFMWGERDARYYLGNNCDEFIGYPTMNSGNFYEGNPANEFDKQWLLECIRLNKFISKDELTIILTNYEIY